MQQNDHLADSSTAIAQYFEKAALPTQQETLGQVVVEILSDGRNLNRKSLCTKLLSRFEKANGPEEEHHYHMLLGRLFERECYEQQGCRQTDRPAYWRSHSFTFEGARSRDDRGIDSASA